MGLKPVSFGNPPINRRAIFFRPYGLDQRQFVAVFSRSPIMPFPQGRPKIASDSSLGIRATADYSQSRRWHAGAGSLDD